MKFDDLQKAWQAQEASAKVVVSADVLLQEVRRNQQQFLATIFWRDVREVGTAVLLALYFLYRGLSHADWANGLAGMLCLGVGAFMMVDRLRQRRKQRAANATLRACLESSLLQINHQIWLLKNVLWWYLLPLAAAVGVSIYGSLRQTTHLGAAGLVFVGVFATVVGLLYWGVYRLNQSTVRKNLEPRRQELESLLSNLK